jgi:hypothetical protein
MLDPRNIKAYSEAQQKQIAKLNAELAKIPGGLDKIQDIALLTSRIAQNEDARARLLRNPEAAAVEYERQAIEASEKAYDKINRNNAVTLSEYVQQGVEALRSHKEPKKVQDAYMYNTLRRMSPTLLDLVDKEGLLSEHQQQLGKAQEWSKVVADLDAVIEESDITEEQQASMAVPFTQAIERASNRKESISNLEDAIDSTTDPEVAQSMEKVLSGMEKLGYQRNATVVENRKQRLAREEAQRKAFEEAEARRKAEEEEIKRRKEEELAKKKAEEEAAKATAEAAPAAEAPKAEAPVENKEPEEKKAPAPTPELKEAA